MVEKRELSLPLTVVELINRMTPEEQEALAAQLSWEQLHALEALKTKHEVLTREQEPHIYVSIGLDSISFESPPEKVAQLIGHIAANLPAKKASVRFQENENMLELSWPTTEVSTLPSEVAGVLADEPIVIEMDGSTLYSQGGGCLFLKTNAPEQTKRAIAETFLQICGYPHQIQSDRFTALVHNGELEIIKP